MSRLIHVSTVQPDHKLELEDVRRSAVFIAQRWGMKPEVLHRIIANAKVEVRYSVLSIDQLLMDRTFKEANDLFIEKSVELGEKAIRKCLDQTGLGPRDIDMLITVSCTGFMIPSMDAFLIERLGMRRDCKRLPITELGCAAGAVGLSRAHEYVKAFPAARVLVLAVELPTLTFQIRDVNMAHVVSSIIFGDGVACALVAKESPTPGPRILDTRSYLFPKSERYMGFDVDSGGFHIVLDRCIPYVVRDTIADLMDGFLKDHKMSREDMRFYALHPAGKKVLQYMEERLEIKPYMTRSTWNVLRTNGNMSSASILYVLQDMMAHHAPQQGEYGAMLAFGPGFSAEMLLARWEI